MGSSSFGVKLLLEAMERRAIDGEGVKVGDIKDSNISDSTKTRVAKELCEEDLLVKDGKRYYPGGKADNHLQEMRNRYIELLLEEGILNL